MIIAVKQDEAGRALVHLVRRWLGSVPIGSADGTGSYRDVFEALENRIPFYLQRAHPEWGDLSINSFETAGFAKTGELTFEAVGTCRLILGQAIAPFALSVRFGGAGTVADLRIRTGATNRGSSSARESGDSAGEDSFHKLLISGHDNDAWGDDVSVEIVDSIADEFTVPEPRLIISREGFSVRVKPPSTVVYVEAGHEMSLFAERLVTDHPTLAVWESAVVGWSASPGPIPLSEPERTRIVANLRRALAWEGTTLLVDSRGSVR